jgi:hypothetical protein
MPGNAHGTGKTIENSIKRTFQNDPYESLSCIGGKLMAIPLYCVAKSS